ncbi:MAG TPA: glycosyl transferase family 2 [Sulfurimonas sp. UBA12504]|nr:MAG: hypothetical protein A2019_08755 [Sulfurimonas sp. GWF2_37_8]DAB29688.1 MAG TPA: glycosyl transferase family 2 [Sulfurimonas sp. UBA12504]
MKILVVIPILNPPSWFFTDVISRLLSQSRKSDILLINSGENIPSGDYEVINISKKDFNHANTRNIALQYDADFYLFITQDATPITNKLIEKLLKNFENSEVAVAYARQVPYADADASEIFTRETNYPNVSKIKSKDDLKTLGIKTFFSSDSCAMYRGDYFRAVNGFTKDLNSNEDMEFAARTILVGRKVSYCAEAKVFHSHNFSLIQIWKRYREIGIFFRENRWILEEVSKYIHVESIGSKQALQELLYLVKKAPLSIPYSIIVLIIKYVAYKSSF